MKSVLFSFYAILFGFGNLNAQQYTLEQINANKARNQQLLGNADSNISFSVLTNSILPQIKVSWEKPSLTILPIILTQQFNSKNPYGWNDGPMMQAKGFQMLARPGVNLRYGVFEAQAAPELLYTAAQSFTKVFPGQSFVKAHIGPLSFGVSSENLWWGPGIYSSLLMSNNAPGFFHGFVGTNRPIKTPIGNLEFKIIGAKLTSDKNLPYENNYNQIQNLTDDWRYLNAYAISWQPKWVPGLFVGMTRSLQQYGESVQYRQTGFINKYLPVLSLAIQKANNLRDDSLDTDQLVSFFLRWVLPKSNVEFYVEYGNNDYGFNIRDYLMAPSHSYAYILGVRKLIPKRKDYFILFEGEITQMTQSPDRLVRYAGNWYEHVSISQGYTNQNQILGSGAGFGANMQTASATWINGEIRNGFFIQRVERDPEGRTNKWTDVSIGWMPQWKFKNMLLGAKVQLIRSNNYNWEKSKHTINIRSRLMFQSNFV